MNIAAGVLLAVIFIVMILCAFSDFIFGMIGEIRRSWNRNMHR